MVNDKRGTGTKHGPSLTFLADCVCIETEQDRSSGLQYINLAFLADNVSNNRSPSFILFLPPFALGPKESRQLDRVLSELQPYLALNLQVTYRLDSICSALVCSLGFGVSGMADSVPVIKVSSEKPHARWRFFDSSFGASVLRSFGTRTSKTPFYAANTGESRSSKVEPFLCR
jgi:hypothetical protein